MSKKKKAAKKAKRARAARKAKRYTLLGALLLIAAPFIPNIYFAFTTTHGSIFPSLTGGIAFWLDIIGIIVLVMGFIVLIGYLVSERDISLLLTVLGGVIGLILGVLGLLSMLPGLPLGPATAILGGLLAMVGALRR